MEMHDYFASRDFYRYVKNLRKVSLNINLIQRNTRDAKFYQTCNWREDENENYLQYLILSKLIAGSVHLDFRVLYDT